MTASPGAEFETHPGFEAADDGYDVVTTPFDATVAAVDGGYRVTVEVPTLDAAVAGETVAPVVEDGWFETFERRLADADGVTRAVTVQRLDVNRGPEVVVVTFAVTATGSAAADDAKALVDYVEGTYMQGVVPGYDYADPVASLRQRAHRQGGGPG